MKKKIVLVLFANLIHLIIILQLYSIECKRNTIRRQYFSPMNDHYHHEFSVINHPKIHRQVSYFN